MTSPGKYILYFNVLNAKSQTSCNEYITLLLNKFKTIYLLTIIFLYLKLFSLIYVGKYGVEPWPFPVCSSGQNLC